MAKTLPTQVSDPADADTSSTRIPVTILSGFLGSGKTTLLKYILESCDHGLKVAVIVNDMAELNIDAALIKQHKLEQSEQTNKGGGTTGSSSSSIVQAEREVISLENGCICCTLRGDLIREIARIKNDDTADGQKFDYVLIESTGIAEPMQVAQAFVFDPATAELATSPDQMLWTQARLDTCVTVIDAHSFADQISTLQQFKDRFTDGIDNSTPEGKLEGERSISDLVIEQVEFSNTILLNKTDLVSEEHIAKTLEVIRALNPTAKIIPTQYSKVDLKEILNTGTFDMNKAMTSPGWIQEIRKVQQQEGPATGEAEEYGVTSFVYRARVPFHPNRIGGWVSSILHNPNEWKALSKTKRKKQTTDEKYQLMLQHYGNILRTKGFCWVAYHDSYMMGISQSGRIGTLYCAQPWFALIPSERWPAKPGTEDYQRIENKFVKPHGDRRQEIVFIGTNLQIDTIQQQLDTCLLTEEELKNYKFYNDDIAHGK